MENYILQYTSPFYFIIIKLLYPSLFKINLADPDESWAYKKRWAATTPNWGCES